MILTGTCSWTEKTLLQSGEFYPGDVKTAKDRLQYYARNFNTVEVDSSYYVIPDINTVSLWAGRTPENFLFHIKAYGALTGHGVNPGSLPRDMLRLLSEEDRYKRYIFIRNKDIIKSLFTRFTDVLNPLVKAGKLGILIFQYPPWFRYSLSGLDYILTCKKFLKGLPLAVEFRHGSWLTPERAGSVFDFLKEHKITYITADEPQYGNLSTIPFLPQVTSDISYFRFHGRNKNNWLKKGIETSLRYDYFYTDNELKEFIKHLISSDRLAKKTFAMFNNCHGGFAIKDALRLNELIIETKNTDKML